MTIKEQFLFIAQDAPVAKIKKEAQKRKKSGEFKSLSEAQNAITKALVNKPFNKAVSAAKDHSPFVVEASDSHYLPNTETTLFVPVPIPTSEIEWGEALDQDTFFYYVPITKTTVTLHADISFNFSKCSDDDIIQKKADGYHLDVNALKTSQFEMIENEGRIKGWWIHSKDMAINIQAADEGITLDLWHKEEGELTHWFESTWILYSELADSIHGYLNTLGKDKAYTDYEAAISLDTGSGDSIEIMTVGGLILTLNNTVTVLSDSGEYFSGSDLNNIFNDKAKNAAFNAWLHGRNIDFLDGWEVVENPWFSVTSEGGGVPWYDASEIPESFEDKMLFMAAILSTNVSS